MAGFWESFLEGSTEPFKHGLPGCAYHRVHAVDDHDARVGRGNPDSKVVMTYVDISNERWCPVLREGPSQIFLAKVTWRSFVASQAAFHRSRFDRIGAVDSPSIDPNILRHPNASAADADAASSTSVLTNELKASENRPTCRLFSRL